MDIANMLKPALARGDFQVRAERVPRTRLLRAPDSRGLTAAAWPNHPTPWGKWSLNL